MSSHWVLVLALIAASPLTAASPAPSAAPPAAKQAAVLDKARAALSQIMALRKAGGTGEPQLTQLVDYLDKASAKGYAGAEFSLIHGRALMERGAPKTNDTPRALAMFEAAATADPGFDSQFELGRAQRRAGQTDAAIQTLEKAVTLAPDHARAHMELGQAYDKSGRPNAAQKYYEHAKAAIRLDPSLKRETTVNSKTSDEIKKITSEIIEKSEGDQLTDEETEKYAQKFQQMLGDKKPASPAEEPPR